MNYSNSQRAGVILYLTALLFGAYVVIGEGKSTNVIIKGMEFGNCISDFEYSATDSLGNLKPTVKLIEVNVETFNPKDGSDTFARLQRMFEKKEADAKETATASE